MTLNHAHSRILVLNAACCKTLGATSLSKATNLFPRLRKSVHFSAFLHRALLLSSVATRAFEIKMHESKSLQVRTSANAMYVSILFSSSVCIVPYLVIANI